MLHVARAKSIRSNPSNPRLKSLLAEECQNANGSLRNANGLLRNASVRTAPASEKLSLQLH